MGLPKRGFRRRKVEKRNMEDDQRTRVVLDRLDAAVEKYNRKALEVELAIRAAEGDKRGKT